MPATPSPQSKALLWFVVVVTTLWVGWLDYATGDEVSILALYFLPLFLAGSMLGRRGAVLASAFALSVWLAALAADGVHFSRFYIWAFNALTAGASFLVVSLLVSLLEESLARERALSRRDQLTGLHNRRSFFELVEMGLAQSKRHQRPVSLAYIDLNHFKQVNDHHGHARGDELLRRCGDLISSCVRASDAVARLGGDEFAVFMPEAEADEAESLVARIKAAIDGAPDIRALGVTLSFGVATENPATSDVAGLIGRADSLMYDTKKEDHAAAGD